ncbi:hypothetical protein [Streptomyces siamensis]|uniref:Serine/threonine protein kinase n=1 Tax=Streptomyces siamensis TaxID=1274986 RepID=A0ABP9IKL8_9ACTN
MTTPQSPTDPYARRQRPPHQGSPAAGSGDSHRTALVVALIGAAATIVAALIGLFVQLSGDSDRRDAGSTVSGASPTSGASGAPGSSGASSAPGMPGPTAPSVTPTPSATSTTPSAAPALAGMPEAFLGRWQGYAEELDASETDHYRVTLELNQGSPREQVGSIHYAMESSDCYGVVTLTAVGGSDRLTLGEDIQSGNCVKNGRITLTLRPGDTVDFAYESTKRDGTQQSVRAGLDRVA